MNDLIYLDSIIEELKEEVNQADYYDQNFRDCVSVWVLRRASELLEYFRNKMNDKKENGLSGTEKRGNTWTQEKKTGCR